MFRYYLTQRPPMPGAFPNPVGNAVSDIGDFYRKKFVVELGRQAWGYVEYKKPLSWEQIDGYELREAGPVFMNRMTGELVSSQMMHYIFERDYDGNDPTNAVGWKEYFEEVEAEPWNG